MICFVELEVEKLATVFFSMRSRPINGLKLSLIVKIGYENILTAKTLYTSPINRKTPVKAGPSIKFTRSGTKFL